MWGGPEWKVTGGDRWGGTLEQESLVGVRLVTCSPEGLQLSSELSLDTSGWSPLGLLLDRWLSLSPRLHHLGPSAQPLSSEPTRTSVLLAPGPRCACVKVDLLQEA